MNERKYKTLKIGDVRMLGDETRKYWNRMSWLDYKPTDERVYEEWKPCSLIGHAILPADLFNAEFRRRII